MRLYSPDSLLYPVTVTKLLRQPGDEIEQNASLFVYEYKSQVTEWDEDVREDVERIRSFYAEFTCELEGTLTSLDVKGGQVLNGRTRVADIEESCRHEVQFGGICAVCGKDMTTVQYSSTAKNTERATVNTVHSHTQLLVSQAEASKADEEAKRRMLDSQKLSLVVDLDQTIIHATVDPTVAEWQRDPSNPNYDAVNDVRSFQLVDDIPGAKGCWYYIKLRPGLEAFLESISRYYELHIYTMGTRAYAEHIAKLVDPERRIFGERILSRDESGSMVAKNLKRLFPVDTKMVVIIDDRGDVWHWSPNLIKVKPFDFFVGIGDINSSFLPKRPELESKPSPPAQLERQDKSASTNGSSGRIEDSTDSTTSSTQAAAITPVSSEVSAVDRLVSMAGSQDRGSIKEKADEQDEQINAQLQDRPLLQKQKILDAADEDAKTSPAVDAAVEMLAADDQGQDGSAASIAQPPKYRHNLLQDDDIELEHLERHLRKVHHAYFEEYKKESSGSKGGRVADLRPGHAKKRSFDQLENIPDAASVMASMKSRVLQGVHLVFSGVVPLGVNIQSHDTAIWAKSFGATVSDNVTKRTTHVIASPERRTAKVRHAAKKPGKIAIVSLNWLFACFTQWKKVGEDDYRIHSDAPSNDTVGLPNSFESVLEDVALSSSDEEETLTEDETMPRSRTTTPNGLSKPLTLNTTGAIETEDPDELEKHMPSLSRADSSPTENESPDYWGEIDDEFAEFMGSEAEDDSDAESIRSTGTRTPPSARKRKREAGEAQAGESDHDDEHDGSRLQKRKKEAIVRTTSLTNVANAPSSTGSTPAADEDPGGGLVEDAGDEDDELEAMLAAEMERQSDGEASSAA